MDVESFQQLRFMKILLDFELPAVVGRGCGDFVMPYFDG